MVCEVTCGPRLCWLSDSQRISPSACFADGVGMDHDVRDWDEVCGPVDAAVL
jgi:hypothetical protein